MCHVWLKVHLARCLVVLLINREKFSMARKSTMNNSFWKLIKTNFTLNSKLKNTRISCLENYRIETSTHSWLPVECIQMEKDRGPGSKVNASWTETPPVKCGRLPTWFAPSSFRQGVVNGLFGSREKGKIVWPLSHVWAPKYKLSFRRGRALARPGCCCRQKSIQKLIDWKIMWLWIWTPEKP